MNTNGKRNGPDSQAKGKLLYIPMDSDHKRKRIKVVMRKKNSITIADIAKKAGVSRTTVSFYLNRKFEKMSSKTRDKIESVIEETEFVPNVLARSLNNKQSYLIGVLLHSLDSKEKAGFLEGVEDCLKENNYQMIVALSGWDLDEERRQIEKMKALGVDGFIVSPSDSFDLLWNTLKSPSPLVVYNPSHVSPYRYWVRTNDYEAVYDALDQAVDAGYKRFILVSEEPGKHGTIAQRCRAFDSVTRLRHRAATALYVADPNDTTSLEYRLVQQIRIDEPTCFFVTTPALLRAVYLVLRRYRELMPESIGLIGINALEWAEMVDPPVTTIVQPAYEAGFHAARLLLDGILEQNKELPCRIFPCRLHALGSTRNVKNKKEE